MSHQSEEWRSKLEACIGLLKLLPRARTEPAVLPGDETFEQQRPDAPPSEPGDGSEAAPPACD